MAHEQFLTILGFGFLLGLRHALDADHIAAVSTLLSKRPNLRASGLIGVCWGLGHTVMLMAVGFAVMALQIRIPQAWSEGFEMGVGMMLVALGGSLAWTLFRDQWHVHVHQHEGQAHIHFHSHRQEDGHAHPHWFRVSLPSFFVGMTHGLAGSAALVVGGFSATQSTWEGMTYILVFGVGSILGMLLLGMIITVPLIWSAGVSRWALPALQGVASLCSIAVGLFMIFHFVWSISGS